MMTDDTICHPKPLAARSFMATVDKLAGTRFMHVGGQTWNYIVPNEGFNEAYAFAYNVAMSKRSELTMDPGRVTSELEQNVSATAKLLDKATSAINSSDSVMEMATAGKPVLDKLNLIEARLGAVERRMASSQSCCSVM